MPLRWRNARTYWRFLDCLPWLRHSASNLRLCQTAKESSFSKEETATGRLVTKAQAEGTDIVNAVVDLGGK